jgi:hypothetical protein
MATRKLKRQKCPGTNQIQAELILAGCRTIFSDVTQHFISTLN